MPDQPAERRAVGRAVIGKTTPRHAGQPLRRRIAAQSLRRPLCVRHSHTRSAAPCRCQRQNIDPVKGLPPPCEAMSSSSALRSTGALRRKSTQ